MASKKAGGSSRNGRDSNPQYRGVKASQGQEVLAGSIIVRQLGNSFWAGKNCKTGTDFSIFATKDGFVNFKDGFKKRKYIEIVQERIH